ncbi:HipA family kinase [Mesorhizobium sp. M8A.F.Ca.ET.165.01.1.1]|uniref:HipA family kinase n=1 Tax=Mesorhizobium sp. M8A.F.Ca.ET.165.01.1.1 TaxID=2563960 RepID=UPI0010937E85|nr:HipA family kinase [Mesorhizobium sp. M8A.F.Ca.ET.165.01.1.1]TGT35715.1 hypothetical protein EN808_32025 [Mesorhizobium sp. M8A.F.Ca.ET.165.01.1.1]
MLSSGQHCQPKEVLREIELFASSTRPARVDTDAGEGFVKGIGNPQGCAALISELVAAELCAWFKLKIPSFAVIKECAIELPLVNWHGNMLPPLFFSRAVDGIPRDGSNTFLDKLTDVGDVARLVVFDTWIKNSDRFHMGQAKSDNLLFVPIGRQKFDLVPIDHTHCFVEIEFDGNPPTMAEICDPTVYGRFPEFDPYLTGKGVRSAIHHLASLDPNFVAEVVNSVPQEWDLDYQARQSLSELICRRAEYVVQTIEARLVAQPDIPGLNK